MSSAEFLSVVGGARSGFCAESFGGIRVQRIGSRALLEILVVLLLPPSIGPWNKNVRSLCSCGLLGPLVWAWALNLESISPL